MNRQFKSLVVLFSNLLLQRYSKISYSQEGEDVIISRLIGNKKNGFYVDVGAHHPLRFSNTYRLYKKGWKGINVDASPNSMFYFKILRPKDINLEIGIADKKDEKEFYMFNEPAINTFSKQVVRTNLKAGYKSIGTKKIKLERLSSILNKYAKNKPIDLLNIDVEGLDYLVLKSNDWSKYNPDIIIIESFGMDLRQVLNSEVTKFLSKKGYNPVAKTANSVIYKKKPEPKFSPLANEYLFVKQRILKMKMPNLTKKEKVAVVFSKFTPEILYIFLKKLYFLTLK